jgi:hypothetical protein
MSEKPANHEAREDQLNQLRAYITHELLVATVKRNRTMAEDLRNKMELQANGSWPLDFSSARACILYFLFLFSYAFIWIFWCGNIVIGFLLVIFCLFVCLLKQLSPERTNTLEGSQSHPKTLPPCTNALSKSVTELFGTFPPSFPLSFADSIWFFEIL